MYNQLALDFNNSNSVLTISEPKFAIKKMAYPFVWRYVS